MRLGTVFLMPIFVASILVSAPAQTQKAKENDDVIRVDTQLVDVPIAAIGPGGRPVRDLKKNNFVIYEDGKQQTIENFSATAAPFEIALVLDTSGSTRSDLQLIKKAAQDFVQSLRTGDRVSISAFNSGHKDGQTTAVSEVLSALTDDRTKLRSAIDAASNSFGTPYYDSILQVAETIFRDPPRDQFRGRRALVALTDGVDSTSLSDFAEVKEKLQKMGIVCFFIKVDTREFFESGLLGDCKSATRFSVAQIRRYYRSLNAKANIEKAVNFCELGDFERLAVSKQLYGIADGEMNELAKKSGGRVFPAADLSEARVAFKSVAEEIGTQYTLGYYSSNEKRDGTYRRIKVELKGLPAGIQIRSREGYTAPAN